MLSNFQDYFSWLLSTIAEFLMSEPIIWLLGTILFLMVFKIFLNLLNFNKY